MWAGEVDAVVTHPEPLYLLHVLGVDCRQVLAALTASSQGWLSASD